MKKFCFALIIILYFNVNAISNETISKIEKNWNQIQSMSGEFHQTDPDGNISIGNFYFLKPYQSKFKYVKQKESIITNESLLRIVDESGFHLESYSIGGNIIKKLLAKEVSIDNEFDLISVENLEGRHDILLRIKNETNDNLIKISFDEKSLDLKKWEIYDEFENKTVLEFTKIKKNIFISQNLFVVKYKEN